MIQNEGLKLGQKNEPIEISENEILLKEYEENLSLAVANYKKASAKQELAFDSYDEECIKEEMSFFRDEVKLLRVKIDKLNNELNTDVV